ncbi:MAG TPA: helix-hairpin-helix domain-containing protein [Polyangiales bacterium]
MHNVHRGHNQREEQRIRRSGPSEEEQRDGATFADAADAQSLDLNHATVPQLEAIDDLGPELARAIVERRVHHGHFTSWEQLNEVEGMNAEKLVALQRAARLAGTTAS